MATAGELADRLIEVIDRYDVAAAIRKGSLDHPETWHPVTVDEVDAYRRTLIAIADEAARLDTEQLDQRDHTLADAVAYGARAGSDLLETQAELTAVNVATGIVPSLVTFLPRYVLSTEEDGERYIVRIDGFGPFLDRWNSRLVDAAAEGLVPNRQIVTAQLEQIDGLLDGGLVAKLGAQAPPTELDDASVDRWRTELEERLTDDVVPALARVRATLADRTLPAARPDDRPGLTHVDGGDAVYRRLLWAHTSLDTSPEDIHAIGLAQIERLADEYREIAGPIVGSEDIDEILRRLRDDESMRYETADEIVADATVALDRAREAAPAWFHRLPDAGCTAHPIEQGALAFYSPPSPDGARGGQFFFMTGDPSSWLRCFLESVTFHESIPGHHLQLALAREDDRVHPLMETYLAPAYCEGWGLYAERLADEMGLYSSQFDRIGMLVADSMRACRLVVDTGIHALGWSRQHAIDFLATNSPLGLAHVAGEVDRYIGRPGQACSYMMGRLAIDAARTNAEQALGDRFDVRAFHDTLLASGSVPLDTMRRLVADWVATTT